MQKLPAFHNEPYTDFSAPANRRAADNALAQVRLQIGREYDLLIGGERLKTGDLLRSVNPSNPEEVIGSHHRATAEMARRAVDLSYARRLNWTVCSEPRRETACGGQAPASETTTRHVRTESRCKMRL